MSAESFKNTSSEYRRDSEKREKTLMEELKEKVDVVKEIIPIIQGVSAGKDPEMVREEFDAFLESVRTRYPEVASAAGEMERLREEANELYPQSEAADDKKEWEISNEEELLMATGIDYRLVLLEKRMNELENNPDVQFLARIERGVESLKEKNEFIHQFHNASEAIIRDVLAKLSLVGEKLTLLESDINEVFCGPFSVTVKIDKMSHLKLSSFHIRRTPYILIKEQEKNNEVFWDFASFHEKTHNILEGFSLFSSYPSKFLKTCFQSEEKTRRILLVEGKHKGEIEETIEDLREGKEEAMCHPLFSKKLVDMLHEEILSDIPLIEAHLQEQFFDKKGKRSKRLGFTTSVKEIKRMKRIFSYAKGREPQEELKERYDIVRDRIESIFNTSAKQMRELLFVSNQLPNVVDIHILFVLLPPSKFSHIKRYITFFYGEDVYKRALASYEKM